MKGVLLIPFDLIIGRSEAAIESFIFGFYKRLSGPLANSLFRHLPKNIDVTKIMQALQAGRSTFHKKLV